MTARTECVARQSEGKLYIAAATPLSAPLAALAPAPESAPAPAPAARAEAHRPRKKAKLEEQAASKVHAAVRQRLECMLATVLETQPLCEQLRSSWSADIARTFPRERVTIFFRRKLADDEWQQLRADVEQLLLDGLIRAMPVAEYKSAQRRCGHLEAFRLQLCPILDERAQAISERARVDETMLRCFVLSVWGDSVAHNLQLLDVWRSEPEPNGPCSNRP